MAIEDKADIRENKRTHPCTFVNLHDRACHAPPDPAEIYVKESKRARRSPGLDLWDVRPSDPEGAAKMESGSHEGRKLLVHGYR